MRFVQGLYTSMSFIISTTYLRELLPENLFSKSSLISSLFWSTGTIFGSLIFLPYALGYDYEDYMFIMSFGAIFPLFRLITFRFLCKETPAYWIKRNDLDNAKKLLKILYPFKNCAKLDINQETYEILIESQLKNERELFLTSQCQNNYSGQEGLINEFEWKDVFKSASIGSFIWLFNIFSGIQVMGNYST